MGAIDTAESRVAARLSSSFEGLRPNTLRRVALDFAISGLLFAALAGLLSIGASNAFPAPPPPELSFASLLLPPPSMIVTTPAFPGMAEGPGTAEALTLLTFAFATLVATNLAIGRHLLGAYVATGRNGPTQG